MLIAAQRLSRTINFKGKRPFVEDLKCPKIVYASTHRSVRSPREPEIKGLAEETELSVDRYPHRLAAIFVPASIILARQSESVSLTAPGTDSVGDIGPANFQTLFRAVSFPTRHTPRRRGPGRNAGSAPAIPNQQQVLV